MTVLQLYQSAVVEGSNGEGDDEKSDSGLNSVLDTLSNTFLPVSKVSIRTLIDLAIAEASSVDYDIVNVTATAATKVSLVKPITMTTNALVAILRLVPPQDIDQLQGNVRRIAPSYQYYLPNASQLSNPLTTKVFPNGGAIHHLTKHLSSLKRRGILAISRQCNVSFLFWNTHRSMQL